MSFSTKYLIVAIELFTICISHSSCNILHINDTRHVIHRAYKNIGRDTLVGIKIRKDNFDRLVIELLKMSEDTSKIKNYDIGFFIKCVRVYNTITVYELNERYSVFLDRFEKNVYEDATSKLHEQGIPGRGLYSRKFNIFLGGLPHKNSQYRLIYK